MTASSHKLLVSKITHEAQGVVAVELCDPRGMELPAWEPGAHLDVHLPSGLIRQYSLCSDPENRTTYRIAVLRAPDSRGGSAEVHDTDLVGQVLEIGGPRNHFELCEAQDYLLIAGGIGITPILAMARELTKQGRSWSMIYGGRTKASMAFTAELADLNGPVDIVPEDERGIPDLEAAISGCRPETAVYSCGPEAMLQAVEVFCAQHLPPGALHVERFAPAAGRQVPQLTGDHEFEVELARSGQVLTVPTDRTVLDVVLDVLPGTPYSCREGYCGTCEMAVLKGEPDHRDDVLTDAEKQSGEMMMICVSRAKSERIVLDL
jgi:ferredoxin-NADP reductase